MAFHGGGRRAFEVLAVGAITATLLGAMSLASPDRAEAARWHSCTTAKQRQAGIFHLKAYSASCRVARQVAWQRKRGIQDPKGFDCRSGRGGNLTPFFCRRREQRVFFYLEG